MVIFVACLPVWVIRGFIPWGAERPRLWSLGQLPAEGDHQMGGSIVMGVPINGWFISGKIPLKLGWELGGWPPMTSRKPPWWWIWDHVWVKLVWNHLDICDFFPGPRFRKATPVKLTVAQHAPGPEAFVRRKSESSESTNSDLGVS